jgi:predicted dehydrogenase
VIADGEVVEGEVVDNKPIRWGVLATGWIAGQFTEDLLRLPDAEVVAVGSRSAEAAQTFAQNYGIGRAHGSWQALAEDPDVDVVYVATPHSAHHAAAKACLEAGKAVLCEKPFTLDLPTTADLVETARARGLFLMEAMWMRTNPAIRRIQELVAGGAIGQPTHVQADFGVQGPFPEGHRMRAPELGGGALLDLGVYPVTFAYLFLGLPSAIRAWASLHPEGTDANTGLTLGYESGAVASLQCGMCGETGQRACITGTEGRIEVPRLFFRPEGFTLTRIGGPQSGVAEQVDMPIEGNGMIYEAREVNRCLREGLTESPLVPLDSSLEIMRILDEARALIGVSYP